MMMRVSGKKYYATANLKMKRMAAGFSQEQIAELLSVGSDKNISRRIYQRIELGEQNIDPGLVIDIAHLVKAEISEIVEGK